MALLRHKNTTPSLGWRYRQKETGLVLTAKSLGELTLTVKHHRQHAHLEPTDMESIAFEIERQICARLGIYDCMKEGPDDDWAPVPNGSNLFSIDKIISLSRSAFEWIKTGGELVTPEEADRRAAICRDCPSNVDSGHGCFNCALGKIVRLAVPAERRPPGLASCSHCGCDLTSKVNVPDSVIVASDAERNIEYPSHCWQRKILASKP
jgi:hypothetical protein